MEATKEVVKVDAGGGRQRKEKPAEPLMVLSNLHDMRNASPLSLSLSPLPLVLCFISPFDTFVLSFYLLHRTTPLSPPRCLFGDVPFSFSLQLNYMAKPVVSAEG